MRVTPKARPRARCSAEKPCAKTSIASAQRTARSAWSADGLLRIGGFHEAGEPFEVGEEEGHLAEFAAELQPVGVARKGRHEVGREIVREGRAQLGGVALGDEVAREAARRAADEQAEEDEARVDQPVGADEGDPGAADRRAGDQEARRDRRAEVAEGRQRDQKAREQDRGEQLGARRPARSREKMPHHDLLDRPGMQVHAGLERVDRRGAKIRQAHGARADQDDLPLEIRIEGGIRRRVDQAQGRDGDAAHVVSRRQLQRAVGVEGQVVVADPHGIAGDGAVLAAVAVDTDGDGVLVDADAKGFERERGHQLAVDGEQQGQAPDHLVMPALDGEAALAGGGGVEHRQVEDGAVEYSGQGLRGVAPDRRDAGAEGGLGAVGLLDQSEAGHDPAAREGGGELLVIVRERGRPAGDRPAVTCRPGPREPGRRGAVGFGEDDVEGHGGGARIL